jgi:hypothetical protein
LKSKVTHKDGIIAELLEENMRLKKTMGRFDLSMGKTGYLGNVRALAVISFNADIIP